MDNDGLPTDMISREDADAKLEDYGDHRQPHLSGRGFSGNSPLFGGNFVKRLPRLFNNPEYETVYQLSQINRTLDAIYGLLKERSEEKEK